jgi:hypothetical protein
MGLRAPRQAGTCPTGSNFYSCNGFRVCCTVDPCSPGQTCPQDKIRGGDATSSSQEVFKSTPLKTLITSTSTSTARTTSASTTESQTSSTGQLSSLSFTTSTTGTATPSQFGQPQPSESTTRKDTAQKGDNSTPIFPIVGGIVGAIVLIAMCALVWVYLKRRRRRRKIYQAPIYPSSDMGNDMSSQLGLTHETKTRNSWQGVQQLDSTEVTSHIGLAEELPRGFAELPAEPAVRGV